MGMETPLPPSLLCLPSCKLHHRKALSPSCVSLSSNLVSKSQEEKDSLVSPLSFSPFCSSFLILQEDFYHFPSVEGTSFARSLKAGPLMRDPSGPLPENELPKGAENLH